MALNDHTYAQKDFQLSKYAEDLDSASKELYKEKLKFPLPNGSVFYLPDPYNLKADIWKDDAALWPRMKQADIDEYLSSAPGKNHKSKTAYQYVVSGKVQNIGVFIPNGLPNFVILSAKVKPSQKCNANEYDVWVFSEEDGKIITGHCTCIAGLGETCSHVAAVLFKVQLAVNIGITSAPTEKKCAWNNTFSKKVKCVPLKEINLEKTKWSCAQNKKKRRVSVIAPKETAPLNDSEIADLAKIVPNAVFLSSIANDSDDSSTDSVSDEETDLPCTLKDIFKEHDILNNEMLQQFFPKTKIENLESRTRSQANALWFEHRCGRLTSSNFGEIFKKKSVTNEFVNKFLNIPAEVNTASIKWGKKMERRAFEVYLTAGEAKHVNFHARRAGFYIMASDPYLGSSPDGIIECDCCGKGVLEIKCPFKHRNLHPAAIAAIDKTFFLDANGCLKENHKYYAQIQGQLAVTNLEYCDFVVWTTVDMLVLRIEKDTFYWESNKPILESFFFKNIAPQLRAKNN